MTHVKLRGGCCCGGGGDGGGGGRGGGDGVVRLVSRECACARFPLGGNLSAAEDWHEDCACKVSPRAVLVRRQPFIGPVGQRCRMGVLSEVEIHGLSVNTLTSYYVQAPRPERWHLRVGVLQKEIHHYALLALTARPRAGWWPLAAATLAGRRMPHIHVYSKSCIELGQSLRCCSSCVM